MKIDRKRSATLDLLLFSGLALYTESVLIRWIGAEIRMFAYLKNFTLLAAFLGLGIGMLRQRSSRISWRLPALISLLALTLVFSAQLRLTRLFFPDAGITQWAGSVNSPLLVPLARHLPVIGALLRFFPDRAVPWIIGAAAFLAGMMLFLIVVQIFILMGERIGEFLRAVQQPPLRAYTLNLLGSLIGTLLFVMVVWLASPPWVWFLPIFLCLLYFSHHRLRDALILGTPLAAAFIMANFGSVFWSPYYRISLSPEYGHAYQLSVDHDFHQDALDLRPAALQQFPQLESARRYYDLPYILAGGCQRVLIVGAGTGNDVAAALRAGCQNVDAVEIDPVIVKLGKGLHPEHPYQSERVHVFVNDGRAFFHQALAAGKTYDLIVFGLVDSQTALSVVSSLRLEFLLYSVESFKEASSLLERDKGLLVVGFSVGWRDWVSQRLYKSLETAFPRPPLAVNSSSYVWVHSFIAGPGLPQAQSRLAAIPGATDQTQTVAGTDIKPVRDDWPFLYYSPQSIPFVYLGSLFLMVAFGWLAVSKTVNTSDSPGVFRSGIDWPMFLMGAAFLLVETKNISQLAILFGATWITNTVVFVSVFVVAILANLIVERKPVANLPVLYGGLGFSLILSYLLPFSSLTGLPFLARAAVGGLITALPVLFSSLIFAKMFGETKSLSSALGSNILGGLLGGAIEASSMFIGVRATALLAIVIYAASWIAYASRRDPVISATQESLQTV